MSDRETVRLSSQNLEKFHKIIVFSYFFSRICQFLEPLLDPIYREFQIQTSLRPELENFILEEESQFFKTFDWSLVENGGKPGVVKKNNVLFS